MDISKETWAGRYKQIDTDGLNTQTWRSLVDRKGEQLSCDLCGYGVKDQIEIAELNRCHHA